MRAKTPLSHALTAVALAAVLLGTAGCGSKSASDKSAASDRPSVAQLTKALSDTTSIFPVKDEKTATCVAKVMRDSKLSDRTLVAIVKGQKDYTESKADKAVMQSLVTKMAGACANSSNTGD